MVVLSLENSFSHPKCDSVSMMDFTECTKVVYERIQALEPENVSKIIGFLLLQDHGEQEMIRLAFGPESSIYSLISKAKSKLGLSPKHSFSSSISLPPVDSTSTASNLPLQFTPFTPSRSFNSSSAFRAPSPYWETQLSHEQHQVQATDFVPPSYTDSLCQSHSFGLEEHLEPKNTIVTDSSSNYYYPDQALGAVRTTRRSLSLPEFPAKACLYFNKGYCRHGASCKFFHGQMLSDGFSQIMSPRPSEMGYEEYILSPGSLEKLEVELTELLKFTRGRAVSLASLPMLYFEKYGKSLLGDGFLAESQSPGKAGRSLTRLLVQMKNIRLIERPHGEHYVVLAEISPRTDPGMMAASARQIYLTFPADSTFSEEDVSDYFNTYGPVEDVRIPSQQKRMFGFVTFVYPETVKLILSKGNPHYVCHSRVLVKPYREKSKLVDRKYVDKFDQSLYNSPNVFEIDHPQLRSNHQISEISRLLQKQLLEEHEQALELQRRLFSEMQLSSRPLTQQQYINHPPMENLKPSEDRSDSPATDSFNYLLDIIDNGSTSEDRARNTNNSCSKQESCNSVHSTGQEVNLPESPFASPVASSISTVI